MTTSTPTKTLLPLGRRPPRADATPIAARALLLLLLLLISFRGYIEQLSMVAANVPPLATLLHLLVSEKVQQALHLGVAAGLGVFALELGYAALLLVMQSHATQRTHGTYLRIRTPRETTPGGTSQRKAQHAGVDFFRALHAVLPTRGVEVGTAPHIALTLVGRPNEPTELGAYVSDAGKPSKGAVWAATVREIIVGQAPDALVEIIPDPLRQVIQPGIGIAWREFSLAHHPSYPLRLADDIERTDLLGPIVAALRCGPGVVQTEAQIIVRPRPTVDLTRDWRVRGMRRLLKIKSNSEYALSPDATALEEKLHVPSYDVTVRLIAVVGVGANQAAAIAELDEATAVIGQYAARSGRRLQRLKPVARGYVRVRKPAPHRNAAAPGYAFAAAVAAVLAWAAVGFPITRSTVPTALSASIPLLLKLLTPVLIGLVLARVVQGHYDIPTWVRVRRLVGRASRASLPSPFLAPVPLWRPSAVLSPMELGGLWHLPTPTLGNLVRWLPNRLLPAPPHAFIVPGAEDRIAVGYARRSDGRLQVVGPAKRDFRQIMHLTAGMGAGKSRLAANICQQFFWDGVTVFDGKGDDAGNLSTTVLHLIPEELEDRVVLVDVLDMDWPVGLNPLAGIDLHQPGGIDLGLGQMNAIFARLDPETWRKAPTMKQLLEMSMRLAIEGEAHPTLAHGKQVLLDAAYRAKLLPVVTNTEVRTFWESTYPESGEAMKTSLQALLRRFDMLLVPELTRYLITQATPTLDFLSCIENKQVVLIPLPHVTLGGLAGAVGMLMFQAFVRAAFQRTGTDQTRTTYPLIVDEFQVLVENGDVTDVAYAVTQLRALGIAAIYAHQALTQIGDARDLMLINAANRVILQTGEPDASVYAKQYSASGATATDMSGQEPNEHQYAVLRCNGAPTGVFSMQPLPWPTRVSVPPPAYDGPDWQRVLPAEPDAADPWVLELIYHAPEHLASTVNELAQLDDEVWMHINARWEAIRTVQRAYILRHRGCIPDRVERLRWLSRLAYCRPRVLAAAEYARVRRHIGFADALLVAPAKRAKRDEVQPFAGVAVPPVRSAYIPGLAAETEAPAPLVAAGPTPEQALRERGHRPSGEDLIADGYTGLRDDVVRKVDE